MGLSRFRLPGAKRHPVAEDVLENPKRAEGSDVSRVQDALVAWFDTVQALGGTLTVLSPPGQGTTMRAELPVGNS